MFCQVEGNADGAGIRKSHRNLYVNLSPFDILPEYPHITQTVERVDNWSFGIVIRLKFEYHVLPVLWRYVKFRKGLQVLLPVVTEYYIVDFHFLLEVRKEKFNFFFCCHHFQFLLQN